MIESRIVIWFEELWFDLENAWFDFDLIWNFMIWFEIIPNHKKIRCYSMLQSLLSYRIVCSTMSLRATDDHSVYWSLIGQMSISTNNWICIPASSATVERLFSTCGAITRATRARLTAKTVEALLFKMEKYTDDWQLDIWAQQHYKS